MGIFRSLSGDLWVEFTSADPVGALTALQNRNIPILEVEPAGDLKYRFCISRRDHEKVAAVFAKRGETLQVCRRQGLYWSILGLWKRPVLLVGLFCLLAVTVWMPGRVLFVQVEGNLSVPDQQILQQAELCGIRFGASRRNVRSEKMKNALLGIMPELQWAGINTYGCLAVITVKERETVPLPDPEMTVSSLVALRDGIIKEITVEKGTALCTPGQAVKAGQTLVSAYTDCGLYIQATRAQGEILALTQRKLTVMTPEKYAFKQDETGSDKNYSLIIGKKRINFAKDSGISGSSCAKIERRYVLTLPGGFQLPLALVITQVIDTETAEAAPKDPEALLQNCAARYLQTQMIAGRVQSAGEVFLIQDGLCRLDGVYGCCEMIGISRPEEIHNGKSDRTNS